MKYIEVVEGDCPLVVLPVHVSWNSSLHMKGSPCKLRKLKREVVKHL